MLEAKWLEALRLPLRIMVGLAISCWVLLALHWQGVLDLAQTFERALQALILVAVVSSVITTVVIIDTLFFEPRRERKKVKLLKARRAVRHEEEEQQRALREKKVLDQLDHLSNEEVRHVAGCLRQGTNTFYAWMASASAGTLRGKGLVWTPEGPFNIDRMPYTFHGFVWDALLKRREEFISKDDENMRAELAARRGRV